ncbi:hypothetical protein NDA03_06020 [Trichocoleus sp. Lan]
MNWDNALPCLTVHRLILVESVNAIASAAVSASNPQPVEYPPVPPPPTLHHPV